MIPIVIPAAGKSSRMRGSDKLMQLIDGIPLLRHTVLTALRSGIGPVLVTLPDTGHPRRSALEGLDLTIIAVPDADEGMNASLRRAVARLPDQSRGVMILLADLPDLSAHDLRTVSECVDLEPEFDIWRGATEEGEPGHPVIFSSDLYPKIAQLTGDEGAQGLVRKYGTQLVPLPGQNARTDLDTPEAWAAWRTQRHKQ